MSIMDLNVSQLSNAIKELSRQLQVSQQVNREEPERLKKYKESGILLEFVLVTSGVVRGRIAWIDNQSLGIQTSSGQNLILYKHAIAFIQEEKGVNKAP